MGGKVAYWNWSTIANEASAAQEEKTSINSFKVVIFSSSQLVLATIKPSDALFSYPKGGEPTKDTADAAVILMYVVVKISGG